MQEAMNGVSLFPDEPKGAGTEVETHQNLSDKLSRWQMLTPLITAAVAVCTFVCSTLYTNEQMTMAQKQSSLAQANQDASDWRSALNNVSFDSRNVAASAFLLESFEASSIHSERALQLEKALLERSEEPEMFDLVYWDMLSDPAGGNQKSRAMAALDLGRSLTEQLNTEYDLTVKDNPSMARYSFTDFLKDPKPFLVGADSKTAARTFVLLYELDSFSASVKCVWDTQDAGCPHFAYEDFDFSDVRLVNHHMSVMPAGVPPVVKSCKVVHRMFEAKYECLEN